MSNKRIRSGEIAVLRVKCRKNIEAGSKILLQKLGDTPAHLNVYPNVVRVGTEESVLRVKNNSSRTIWWRKYGPIGCVLSLNEEGESKTRSKFTSTPSKTNAETKLQTFVSSDNDKKQTDANTQTTVHDRQREVNDSQSFGGKENLSQKPDDKINNPSTDNSHQDEETNTEPNNCSNS